MAAQVDAWPWISTALLILTLIHDRDGTVCALAAKQGKDVVDLHQT